MENNKDYNNERLKLENEKLRLENENLKLKNNSKEGYSFYFNPLIFVWILGVIAVFVYENIK